MRAKKCRASGVRHPLTLHDALYICLHILRIRYLPGSLHQRLLLRFGQGCKGTKRIDILRQRHLKAYRRIILIHYAVI